MLRDAVRLVVLSLVLLTPALVQAESWCAYPLWVHEWGVQAFDANGTPTPPVNLPPWFHRSGAGAGAGTPTRHLPPDGGERDLPVLHFYSSGSLSSPIPIGIEVGFQHGEASAWYPQVDMRRQAGEANSTSARRQRAALLRQRQQLTTHGARPSSVPSDPTRQLVWDRLLLSAAPQHTLRRSQTPWVDSLRNFDAMWVNGTSESERFVFYEARSSERVALSVGRGNQWRAGRRHYVVRNRGTHPIHDVFVTHREGSNVFVFFAPTIPAGRSTGFVLEEHRMGRDVAAQTRGRLRTRMVDATQPTPPRDYRWDMDDCTMMRDPAVPFEESEGHRIYAHEADAVLGIWAPTFFDRPGTTITYREDTAYLDTVMPLSIYTDMYNFVLLRRAGLAVWSNVRLP